MQCNVSRRRRWYAPPKVTSREMRPRRLLVHYSSLCNPRTKRNCDFRFDIFYSATSKNVEFDTMNNRIRSNICSYSLLNSQRIANEKIFVVIVETFFGDDDAQRTNDHHYSVTLGIYVSVCVCCGHDAGKLKWISAIKAYRNRYPSNANDVANDYFFVSPSNGGWCHAHQNINIQWVHNLNFRCALFVVLFFVFLLSFSSVSMRSSSLSSSFLLCGSWHTHTSDLNIEFHWQI